MNIAIIPARAGSKRIYKKNITNFFGKPLIYYSIKNLKNSKIFDKIYVSTDCNDTQNLCKKFDVDVLKRPKYLCADKVSTDEVIYYHFKSLMTTFKNIIYGCCMYPTAPLVSSKDLIKAYKMIRSNKVNSVFPVTQYDFPVHQALRINKSMYSKPLFKKYINKNSQELKELYHDSGTFYLLNICSFLKKRKIFYNNRVFILPNSRVQDINNISDLEIAKIKYLYNKKTYETKNIFL